MTERRSSSHDRKGEAGIALLLAILSLMLLTFLGLALAASTSTELQIAQNYNWGQQALYNAEAGIEVGRAVLRYLAWTNILPAARSGGTSCPTKMLNDQQLEFSNTAVLSCWTATGPWPAIGLPTTHGNSTRNCENGFPGSSPTAGDCGGAPGTTSCDAKGGQAGYGVVLNDGTTSYENVSTITSGQMASGFTPGGTTFQLNGSFTLWVRRELLYDNTTGYYADSPCPGALCTGAPANYAPAIVLTSEGIAPFTSSNLGATAQQAQRAIRLMEVKLKNNSAVAAPPCGTRGGQIGGGPGGAGFGSCTPVTGAGVASGIGAASATDTGAK